MKERRGEGGERKKERGRKGSKRGEGREGREGKEGREEGKEREGKEMCAKVLSHQSFSARKNVTTEREKEYKEELDILRRQLKDTRQELASYTHAVEKCESCWHV